MLFENMGKRLAGKLKDIFTRLETYYLIGIFIPLIYMLLVESAGIADNGDFQRVLIPNFMYYLDNLSYEQLYFDFVNTKYKIENFLPLLKPIYLNTHALLLTVAKVLNVILYSRTIFELRFLSFVYIIIFLYGMYLIFKAVKSDKWWINVIMFSFITLVLCDRGNILYFGSLYAEPVSFVSFILAVGLLLNMLRFKSFTKYNVIMFFVSTTFFMGSKVQYGLLSVLFILPAFFMTKLCTEVDIKRLIKLMTALMIVISIGVYIIQPVYLDEVTTFDSVFCGVLVGDEEADKEALAELGIDEEYYVLAGMDGFLSEYPIDINSEEFRENFYNKIGKVDLVIYYLKHFDRLWTHLENTAEASFVNLPEYLGNRTEEFSNTREEYNKFNLYDNFKRIVIPKNIIFVLGFFLLYFIAELLIAIRCKNNYKRIWSVFLMTLIVFCGIQFVLPTVGNGGIDISKQLYMFNVVFDILLLNLVYRIIFGLKRNLIEKKFGRN